MESQLSVNYYRLMRWWTWLLALERIKLSLKCNFRGELASWSWPKLQVEIGRGHWFETRDLSDFIKVGDRVSMRIYLTETQLFKYFGKAITSSWYMKEDTENLNYKDFLSVSVPLPKNPQKRRNMWWQQLVSNYNRGTGRWTYCIIKI